MEGVVQANEVKDLYTGHEVSAHTVNHPGLPDLSADEIRKEVLEDRRNLEELVGYPVRGMSYPFGPYNQKVIDTIRSLGIEYARTIQDTHTFGIPDDFLAWHPTMHQFGEAYYDDAGLPDILKLPGGELTDVGWGLLPRKNFAIGVGCPADSPCIIHMSPGITKDKNGGNPCPFGCAG